VAVTDPSPLNSLALPFRTAPLLLVGIFSVLLQIGLNAGLFGIPMLAIIGSWFLKYAFMLLDHAAQGRPDAPVLTPEAANPVGEKRPLAYAALIAGYYLATGALGPVIGPEPVSALRLLALAALPAVVATHTITGSWAEALNPRTIIGTTRRLGVGYVLILCVAIGCWWLGRAIVLDAGYLAVILRIALLMLLWLTLFSLLGGVIHARRLELGFEPEHSPERRQRRDIAERDRARNLFLDLIFTEYRSGDSRNAWNSIQQRAAQSADLIAEYSWIYERVATWPKPRLANRIAQALLPLLLNAKRNGEALRIVKERLHADREFRPLASSELIALALLARDGGDRPLARALLQDFDRHFPGDALSTRARDLSEQLAR
jgi:hypothetical protein